jgi:hypothetical protein
MNLYPALVVACLGIMPALSNAFTLDAVGYDGSELSRAPYSVFVPGYGEMVLETDNETSLVVHSAYRNDSGFAGPSLSFHPGDAVKITFDGHDPGNSEIDFFGAQRTENRDGPKAELVPHDSRGEARSYAMSWSKVPEPTSSAIGLLSTVALILRRRR